LSDPNKRSQYDKYGLVSDSDYEELFEQASNAILGERIVCVKGMFALYGVTAEDLEPSL